MMPPFIEHIIPDADEGLRLDRWLKREYPHLSYGLLQKWLRKGTLRVDGRKVSASHRLGAGETVRLPENARETPGNTPARPVAPASAAAPVPDWLVDAILYQNTHLLALNKPPGIAVQGGTGQRTSVDAWMAALAAPDGDTPRLVHRLDKDTSGILLLAKHRKSAAALTRALRERTIEKTYWALVVGVPDIAEGTIDLPLSKAGGRSEKMHPDPAAGRRAITHYRVRETIGVQLAWLEMFPVTGRTHQLRVHAAAIGHPIYGDGKYGGRQAFITGLELPRRLHLHARALALPQALLEDIGMGDHREEEAFSPLTAPLPPHMQESWAMLGLYA